MILSESITAVDSIEIMIGQVLVGIAVGYWLGRSTTTTTKNSNNDYDSSKVRRRRQRPTDMQDPEILHLNNTLLGNPLRIKWNFAVIGLAVSLLSDYLRSFWLDQQQQQQEDEDHGITYVVEEDDVGDRRNSKNNDDNDDDETTSCATTTSTTSAPLLETTITTTTTTSTAAREQDENDEDALRTELKRTDDPASQRQSTVPLSLLPKHIAVIMDGNRRYGLSKYGNKSRGHYDGSSKLIEFAKWCLIEHIPVLTVYAFSTENWNRPQTEIDSLMEIFITHCDELRIESQKRNIRVVVLSTDTSKIPPRVQAGLDKLVNETRTSNAKLTMNICLSYGSRGEIVQACQSLAHDAMHGKINPSTITEDDISQRLLTSTKMNEGLEVDRSSKSDIIDHSDPDILIRTSGEVRISNFLLWQMAYTELFFLSKTWPEITKNDLLTVIEEYATGRKRRFGQ